MKKLTLLILLVAGGCITSFAQCMLKVSTTDKQAINVALDGRYFNSRGTSVTVGDLPAGNHYLQIYGVIRKKNGKLREAVIYEGQLSINHGMITFFVFDPLNGGTITEQDIDSYVQGHPLPPEAHTGHYDDVNHNDNNNNGNNNEADNNNNDGGNGPVASPVAIENTGTLTDAKTAQLKAKVIAKKTDTDKMKVLKDGLKDEKISTDQVAFMSDWLSFESTKLEFIEWAYNITADKENYNMLDAKFSFKQYQDGFAEFLNKKK